MPAKKALAVKKNTAPPIITVSSEPKTAELVTEWLAAKATIKANEKIIDDLKKRMGMLLPANIKARKLDAVRSNGNDEVHGWVVIKRIEQDRRKPDPVKLAQLIQAKGAPSNAFQLVAKEEYVASMLEDGTITLDEFKDCLNGNVVKYVQADFVVENPIIA